MMFLIAIVGVLASTLALPVIPDPPTLPNRNSAALQDSKIQTRNIKPFTFIVKKDKEVKQDNVEFYSGPTLPSPELKHLDCIKLQHQLYELKQELNKRNQEFKYENIPIEENNENNEGKEKKGKVTMVAVPPPPELPSFDYSTLKKQKHQEKQEFIETNKQFKVENNPVEDKIDKDEGKQNNIEVALVAIPPPPALKPFDYSTLKKNEPYQQPEKTNVEVNYENIPEQEDNKVALVAVPSAPEVPACDCSSIQTNKYVEKQESISSEFKYDDVPVQEKNYNNEVKESNIKVALVAVPPPPALPPFDYSTLKKQKYEKPQEPEKPTEEIQDKCVSEQGNNRNCETDENNFKTTLYDVPSPPNLPSFDCSTSKTAECETKQESITLTSEFNNDIPDQDQNGNNEVNVNNIKEVLVAVPPPPSLPPFDYSSLKKQEQKPQLQPTTTTEEIIYKDITERDSNDNDEPKKNNIKVALVAVPPPPALKPFDYSSLKKQKYEQKQQPETKTEEINCEDIPEQNNNVNGETKENKIKVTLDDVPSPPELLPFDYSTLTKIKYDQPQEPKKSTTEFKEEKFPVHNNARIEEVKEVKNNVALVAVPPPPELQPYDYSNLKKLTKESNPTTLETKERPERPFYPSLSKLGMQCLCLVPSISRQHHICNLPSNVYQQ